MLHYFECVNGDIYFGDLERLSNGFFEVNWPLLFDEDEWRRLSYMAQNPTNPDNMSYINSSLVVHYGPVDENNITAQEYYRVKDEWLFPEKEW